MKKRTLNKILVLLLVLGLAVAGAGCGGNGDQSQDEADTLYIGLAAPLTGESAMQAVSMECRLNL